jgi:hypothetical protein
VRLLRVDLHGDKIVSPEVPQGVTVWKDRIRNPERLMPNQRDDLTRLTINRNNEGWPLDDVADVARLDIDYKVDCLGLGIVCRIFSDAADNTRVRIDEAKLKGSRFYSDFVKLFDHILVTSEDILLACLAPMAGANSQPFSFNPLRYLDRRWNLLDGPLGLEQLQKQLYIYCGSWGDIGDSLDREELFGAQPLADTIKKTKKPLLENPKDHFVLFSQICEYWREQLGTGYERLGEEWLVEWGAALYHTTTFVREICGSFDMLEVSITISNTFDTFRSS